MYKIMLVMVMSCLFRWKPMGFLAGLDTETNVFPKSAGHLSLVIREVSFDGWLVPTIRGQITGTVDSLGTGVRPATWSARPFRGPVAAGDGFPYPPLPKNIKSEKQDHFFKTFKQKCNISMRFPIVPSCWCCYGNTKGRPTNATTQHSRK